MILRCEGPRRRCGLGRMSRGGPRRYGGDFFWGCNMPEMSLASPIDMV